MNIPNLNRFKIERFKIDGLFTFIIGLILLVIKPSQVSIMIQILVGVYLISINLLRLLIIIYQNNAIYKNNAVYHKAIKEKIIPIINIGLGVIIIFSGLGIISLIVGIILIILSIYNLSFNNQRIYLRKRLSLETVNLILGLGLIFGYFEPLINILRYIIATFLIVYSLYKFFKKPPTDPDIIEVDYEIL